MGCILTMAIEGNILIYTMAIVGCIVILTSHTTTVTMGWLQLVGSIKLYVTFAKETYERDDILQKDL